uniref:Spindle assembly abnormal protein 6 N-terminal domain-containing protein n=1 Tax=Fibrocapsa japonica TaxID=94617 RepID=A0A7S2UUP1_9STRA|mmetsp:Transcript_11215/g.16526  ORF Transcript_11215/g.16526 Transcript_11215/m.16526 type:complete len:240 (+) Transcript_11215:94-813(+)|eukprot:CAMPEP_0113937668 /NCGR_PEP_ID=MMETSP1339-20121228/4238_1 /TAXON_ID=94617 /ORGANISM="Fibrocapsa japonica" /LENGTH=239 /DNA_ID=CAMNT_0000940515 /DNA_START=44 /DNA_END=766 /DNA_ORIENTATION=+ /assembly_acc=CAM_ASM_000762
MQSAGILSGAGGVKSSDENLGDLMQTLDFSAIEEMDPSVVDGHRVIYDREVPFEVRLQDSAEAPQQVGTLEAIKVKVLLLGDDANPESVRIELSSEADLFFHYYHQLDLTGFKTVQDQQRLMVEFPDYPNVLIRMLNNCIKEPHSCLAVFVMQQDVHARLDFIQNMEYKFVELMTCHFVHSPEDSVQRHITYRYKSMKSRLALMQNRLQEVNNLVKMKNPSLLLQLQRSGASSASTAGR